MPTSANERKQPKVSSRSWALINIYYVTWETSGLSIIES